MTPEQMRLAKGMMAPQAYEKLEAARAAGPMELGGATVAAPTKAVAPDLSAPAGRLAAAKAAEAAAVAKARTGNTDNSQWQVHINTRSEKEMEQAMLKVLQKQQQKLAN